jgi:hypothetical protein
MTAIYAYARDEIAFVAGDTIRTDYRGVQQPVCKLHRWSDRVLLAQAGEAEALSKLLLTVVPLAGWVGATADDFVRTFQQCRARFWDEARRVYEEHGRAVTNGTVLIAEAARDGAPARICKLDFETGHRTITEGRIDADGRDVPQFQADAHRHLEALQGDDEDHDLPLDMWAVRCVQDAAATHPGYIDLPVDVLIARPSEANDRIVVYRRIRDANALGLDLFRAH